MTKTLANGYSYEITRRELSNEYQHDRVSMVSKNICVLVLWMKVASALEGLNISKDAIFVDVSRKGISKCLIPSLLAENGFHINSYGLNYSIA